MQTKVLSASERRILNTEVSLTKGVFSMRTLKAFVVLAVILGFSATAYAERGLGGIYTKRHLTVAPSSLKILAGPNAAQTVGVPATPGFTFLNPEPTFDPDPGVDFDIDSVLSLNIGAVYGITDSIEAGAIFAPLQLSGPEGDDDLFRNIPVWITYGMDMGNFDVGFKLTTIIPILEGAKIGFVPGVPFLFRGSGFRIDSGIFVPIKLVDGVDPDTFEETTETIIDLNIPVRAAFQINPNIYAGIATGLNLANLSAPEGVDSVTSVPLGVFAGYTLLAGGRVIDLGLSFDFPQALLLSGPEGLSTTQFSWYSFTAGGNVALKF